jgi:hypothetical protein
MTIANIIIIMSICIGILVFCIYVALILQDIHGEIHDVYLKIMSVENDYRRFQNNMYGYNSTVHKMCTMVEDMAVQNSYSLKDKIKLYLGEKLAVD